MNLEKEITFKKGDEATKLSVIVELMKGMDGLFEVIKDENADSARKMFGADTKSVTKEDLIIRLSISIPEKEVEKINTQPEKSIDYIIMNRLGLDESDLDDNAHFYNDLGGDILDLVEVVTDIENRWEITITNDEEDELNYLSDFYRLIRTKLNK